LIGPDTCRSRSVQNFTTLLREPRWFRAWDLPERKPFRLAL